VQVAEGAAIFLVECMRSLMMLPIRVSLAASAAAVVLATATPAAACKCALVPRDRSIISTPLVFQGRVVKIDTQGDAQVTTLMVVRNIKGMSKGETVQVRSRTSSAACGYDFREGKETLLVGAFKDEDGVMIVRRCAMYNLNR
jgi:hypothetical protein